MSLALVFLAYAVVATIVVLVSVKASDYVDLLDKKTNLSGAFIGGVMLSAVTSLPELFTSISSCVLVHEPGLCMGNILGSNLFNVAMLSVVLLIAHKSFKDGKIAVSHGTVSLIVAAIYGVLALELFGVIPKEILTISLTSVLIALLYFIGVKNMSGDDSVTSEEEDTSPLTVKQIIPRFILVAVGIVVSSIVITYITDELSVRLNLGAGLAGALFLGVATSLPEMASTIALVRKKNYNIAFGNIVGSNLFNFFILTVSDIIYTGEGLYGFSDVKNVNLLGFGAISMALMFILIKYKNKVTRYLCPVLITVSYLLALIIGG